MVLVTSSKERKNYCTQHMQNWDAFKLESMGLAEADDEEENFDLMLQSLESIQEQ